MPFIKPAGLLSIPLPPVPDAGAAQSAVPAPTTATPQEAAPEALQDPVAGGHYVRDPVTGALSQTPVSIAQPE